MDIATYRPRHDSIDQSSYAPSEYDISQVQLKASSSVVPHHHHDDASESGVGSVATKTAATSFHPQVSWEPRVAQRIHELIRKSVVSVSSDDTTSSTVHSSSRPFLLAMVGIPGSGKSISALLLCNELEKLGLNCMIFPHDGYHYPLQSLKLFPNAEDAVYRRGAPDTFDANALKRDLQRIQSGPEDLITVPGFDHAKGDPEPDRHAFDRKHHHVVLCEGLWLLHNQDGWEGVSDMFDFKLFLESNVDACVERVKIRNRCIPGYTPEEIEVRAEKVDRVNAMAVMATKQRADLIVDGLASNDNHTKTSAEEEVPVEVTLERSALAGLSLKDTDLLMDDPFDALFHQDWAMDITSRPESLWEPSEPALSRGNSFANKDWTNEPPEPASAHLGNWEPMAVQQILQDYGCKLETAASNRPYMVALVGIPGSGKTVSAFLLANLLEEAGYPTMIMPHDGYHYPLDYLKTFPDPEDAIYRRGAPDTFDAHALHRDLTRIKEGDEELILLPAFDHSRADPEPDTHAFDRNKHKIVLCEGLWLLHNQDGWEEIPGMFDYRIFLDSNVDVCIDRVKIRNKCIPGYSAEEIDLRCDAVDRVNAMTCLQGKGRADIVVDSGAATPAAQ